ncbi:CdaR family protein [Macrococcus equipercicus]|uniref:YbbR-like domain-containing protein n=1 Tax=Macrococcus equipercicus TaxID=69967 RepID=A0A9Q9BW83_9STAP|nr:CdaR family protein [Macrococcus equipercicus]KAA1036928.1 hypothetical protein ERX35_010380 [Macrococcus equipercicus]UTH14168.1 hypothetical protein KFV11_02040 [Macrococcus equipercicus]
MLETKWGLRLISLVLALFLFLSVNDVFGTFFTQEQFNESEETVIQDVPVETVYDQDNLYLAGAPKTVNIRLAGPTAIIKKTESMRDFKVKLDLSHDTVGDHKKKFIVEGLSDKLSYVLMPKTTNVTLSEKTSVTNQVEAEISDSRIATGYELIGQEVDPSQVTITGGEDEINKIAYVKATLDNKTKLSESTTEEAEVGVFDAQLNKLDVTVKPAKVKINIKVAPSSKLVSIMPKTTGQLPAELKVNKISLSDDQVELFGKRSVLDGIGNMQVEVNLDKITKDTVLKQKIPLPKDVTKAAPDEVTVTIDVDKK